MKRLILISASIMIASAAFAQSEQSKCVSAPVSITGNQVTLTSSGNKSFTKEKVYVYYVRRHHSRHAQAYPVAGLDYKYPSRPVMLSCDKDVNTMPETYNVSLSTPESNVAVCPDSTLNLSANINVEKVSSYTGNYPGTTTDKKVYKKVPKREYKMVARKMRKIERNEQKVARKAGGATVEASSRNV